MPIKLCRRQGQWLQSDITPVWRIQMGTHKNVQLTGYGPPERRSVGLRGRQHQSTAECLGRLETARRSDYTQDSDCSDPERPGRGGTVCTTIPEIVDTECRDDRVRGPAEQRAHQTQPLDEDQHRTVLLRLHVCGGKGASDLTEQSPA